MQDPADSELFQSVTPESDPSPRRHRKRKVKRSVKIKRKAVYIIALVFAWLILLAAWYYLVGIGQHPPAELPLKIVIYIQLYAAERLVSCIYVAEGTPLSARRTVAVGEVPGHTSGSQRIRARSHASASSAGKGICPP